MAGTSTPEIALDGLDGIDPSGHGLNQLGRVYTAAGRGLDRRCDIFTFVYICVCELNMEQPTSSVLKREAAKPVGQCQGGTALDGHAWV